MAIRSDLETASAPVDGPDEALGRVTRRLGLRYTKTFIARRLAAHTKPNSLLALVETAPSLGISVTAGKTDPSELELLSAPTIVHFGGSEGGGFGIFEGATPEGFKIWDSRNGLRVIPRSRFLAGWSGIVVLVERDESARIQESGWLKNRAVEILFGSIEPPAVVGSRAASWVRVAFGALVLAGLGYAIRWTPSDLRLQAVILVALALLGLAVTIVTGVSVASQNSPFADRICSRGKYVNCQSVLASKYSRVFGFSLSDLGIALYAALLLLVVASAPAEGSTAVWDTARLVFFATVPFSVLLIGTQIVMRQLCTLCLTVHAVNLTGAAVAALAMAPDSGVERAPISSLILFAVFYGIVLLFVLPMFRKHQGLTVLAGMHRRIAASPFASLAEILTQPPTDAPAADLALPLPGPDARHELTVFVHPSCNKCDGVFSEVRALVQAGLIRARVGLAPRNQDEADRRGCAAVVAAGMGAAPLDTAYAAAKNNLRAWMEDDPVEVVSGGLSMDRAQIEPHLATARELVERAEVFVDANSEGTPAMFIDSRLYRGELAHLAYLLQEHPDLLEPILGGGAIGGAS